MNTRHPIDDSAGPQSLSVAFNQNSSCFSVGLDTGFCVFNADPCEIRVSRDFKAGVGAVEMLGRAQFVALVGGGKRPKFPQHKVMIWDDSKQQVVFPLEFSSPVRGVRLSRSRIVAVLQNSVHIYSLTSPPQRLQEFETTDNPLGLCALGSRILAFPGRTAGQVQVVEIPNGNVSIIPAHGSPLRALHLSPDEELLATASETGTLIRVYATSNCARLAELRRGVDHATIFSIAISPSSKMLAVTSDKSTLHIFDLPLPWNTPPSASETETRTQDGSRTGDDPGSQKWGILGKIPLMPRVFSDVYSFASAHFEMGDDLQFGNHADFAVGGLALPAGKPSKGVIGWLGDDRVLVVGAGRDGRWEKFVFVQGEDGKRYCVRDGWKRYLGAG